MAPLSGCVRLHVDAGTIVLAGASVLGDRTIRGDQTARSQDVADGSVDRRRVCRVFCKRRPSFTVPLARVPGLLDPGSAWLSTSCAGETSSSGARLGNAVSIVGCSDHCGVPSSKLACYRDTSNCARGEGKHRCAEHIDASVRMGTPTTRTKKEGPRGPLSGTPYLDYLR